MAEMSGHPLQALGETTVTWMNLVTPDLIVRITKYIISSSAPPAGTNLAIKDFSLKLVLYHIGNHPICGGG